MYPDNIQNMAQTQAIPSRNGLTLSFFNDFQTFLNASEAYFHLGYAVIPLLGDFDPTRPKVPAIAWSAYQNRRPTLSEIESWFSPSGKAAALGIVTGRISQLVVLDFDSQTTFDDFRRRCPDLLETRTVHSASRGLPHLYFHLPSHLHLTSHKAPGIDLLSDGRYVVAPPTVINGQPYKLIRGGMPRTLTQSDIQHIQSFITAQKSTPSPLPNNVDSTAHPLPLFTVDTELSLAQGRCQGWGEGSIPSPVPVSPTPSREKSGLPTTTDLHALYHYWLTKGGRNDALFRTALHARDAGWDETRTRRALTTLHVSRASHLPEPVAIRQREAYATIRSAFSRPARPQKAVRSHQRGSIANSAREALMQHHQTFVVRTIEGLMKKGFRAEQVFTADQAIHALKGLVGRDSVYNALNALSPIKKPFFAQISPSALPPASKEAAKDTKRLKTKKCFFVTEKKSGIKKRGPKHRLYRMPHNRDICRLLGVKPSGSDPLTHDDLGSARQTRMALHRELIKRRPANYSRGWLAHRLGVSRRTLDLYNRLIPIHSRPTYNATTLSWTLIDRLPADEPISGAFIETLTGKRYPALRSIAAHLLAKGTYIRLQQRIANYYWYGSDHPPTPLSTYVASPSRPETAQQPREPAPSSVGESLRPPRPTSSPADPVSGKRRTEVDARQGLGLGSNPPAHTALNNTQSHSVGEGLRPSRLPSSPSPVYGGGLGWGLPAPARSHFRKPLPEAADETRAQHLYTLINQRTPAGTRQLSLNNARRLISTYSPQQITQALALFQRRASLDNPTGFFVTVLRSSIRQEIK